MKRLLTGFFIVIGLMGFSRCQAADCDIDDFFARIVKVNDGDTITVRSQDKDIKIRLLNIDTPEVNYRGKNQGELAFKASDKLKKLLPPNAPVWIKTDKEKCGVYGRVLGLVFKVIPTKKELLDVNRYMVDMGYAVPYIIYPNTRAAFTIIRAAREAQRKGLGIYSPDSNTEIPYLWRRKVSNRQLKYITGDALRSCYERPKNFEKVNVTDRIFFKSMLQAKRYGFEECNISRSLTWEED